MPAIPADSAGRAALLRFAVKRILVFLAILAVSSTPYVFVFVL